MLSYIWVVLLFKYFRCQDSAHPPCSHGPLALFSIILATKVFCNDDTNPIFYEARSFAKSKAPGGALFVDLLIPGNNLTINHFLWTCHLLPWLSVLEYKNSCEGLNRFIEVSEVWLVDPLCQHRLFFVLGVYQRC